MTDFRFGLVLGGFCTFWEFGVIYVFGHDIATFQTIRYESCWDIRRYLI